MKIPSVAPGRPRSKATHAAILAAAAELVREDGMPGLTVEGIAARAKTSKQTVYRWWGNKFDVLAEAIVTGVLTFEPPVLENCGNLRADLTGWFHQLATSVSHADTHKLVQTLLIASAQSTDIDAEGEGVAERMANVLFDALAYQLEERLGDEVPAIKLPLLVEMVVSTLLRRLALTWPIPEPWLDEMADFVVAQVGLFSR